MLFTSCNSTQLFNSDSSIDSSISRDSLDDETMLVASIPNEFICFGKIYKCNNEKIETLKLGNMIGYLINENELDFLKNKDNNSDIVYALDTGNSTYRYTYENDRDLENRFELYAQDEAYDCLVVKCCSNNDKLMLYYRQRGTYKNIFMLLILSISVGVMNFTTSNNDVKRNAVDFINQLEFVSEELSDVQEEVNVTVCQFNGIIN